MNEYWVVRNKAKELYNDAVELVVGSNQYRELRQRCDELNDKAEQYLKYFICTYVIHPDDVHIVEEQEQDEYRGCYSDTMHRSDHFNAPIIYTKYNQLPFPMPNEPTQIIVSSPEPNFGLSIDKFANFNCMDCNATSNLPNGFYCKRCASDAKLVNLTHDSISQHILQTLLSQVETFESIPLEAPIENTIEVSTYSSSPFGDEDGNDSGEIIIRLILTLKQEIQICPNNEHDYQDIYDYQKCSKCIMTIKD